MPQGRLVRMHASVAGAPAASTGVQGITLAMGLRVGLGVGRRVGLRVGLRVGFRVGFFVRGAARTRGMQTCFEPPAERSFDEQMHGGMLHRLLL